MMNVGGFSRFLMRRSCSIKLTFWISLLSFIFSIIFTIANVLLQCQYSVLFKPCSSLAPQYPFECEANSNIFCCQEQSEKDCSSQCMQKPDNSVRVCMGMLATTWSLYLIFVISFFSLVLLYRKLSPQIAEDYVRMTQSNEISHVQSDAENAPNVNIHNAML